ncbi:hypothetical protein Asulf_00621 [Archaeoglobus sulfaticallidus PM70-1]|uniref:DUF429 domain-containing protein n=1 Tax=Archaeoglobus sulfaticallidus PM70-1 TaxID=387631 RepID=N0BKE1_9EURY|nr:DUF429 domain-containing protein [Archaeoglobus sulfaticallidus]AGK60640.1 hypothetical protein Asulf_00621 [Archaeoglobus sulfaticallidus PM70-1]
MKETLILGIDVGKRASHYVLLEDNAVVDMGKFEDVVDLKIRANYAGVDAPLSFPTSGSYRECEKELIKRGIRLFPPNANFFRKITHIGMKIARFLRENGTEVFEVYPYATRKILNIAPELKKNTKSNMRLIQEELRKYLNFDEFENHDLLDSAISALTVKLFLEGRGDIVGGVDGKIIVPKVSSYSITDM